MQTIKLQVSNETYKHLMWFLSKFKKDEIHIIEEDKEFVSTQNYLKEELRIIEDGKAEFINIDELNAELETTIRQHEG